MTEAEQWAQINYPSFFGAIGDKITAAKAAMAAVPVTPDADNDYIAWLQTNVNEVPIYWHEPNSNDCVIRVGVRDSDGKPMYEITVPTMWLAA
jgi:hypothetical protein